jgi:uncharacterized membrane protein (DUF485 family)
VSTVESPGAQPPTSSEDVYARVHADPRYAELRKRHRSFVVPVALLFLGWYFLFVLMADYAHEFMSTKVWGNINIGLIFGLLQFVSTFAITMAYVRYADRKLDPLADELRNEAERGGA